MTLNLFLNVYFIFSCVCVWGGWFNSLNLLWPKVHSDIQLVDASREQEEWVRSSRSGEITTVAGERLRAPADVGGEGRGGISTYRKVLLRPQKSAGLRVCSISALSQLHLLSSGGVFKNVLWCHERRTYGFNTWKLNKVSVRLMCGALHWFLLLALCAWWFILLVLFLFWSGLVFIMFPPPPPPCEKRQLHFLLKCLTGWHLAF